MGILLGKKSVSQVRQGRLANPPSYFVLHFNFVDLFYGRTKGLCPDPIVGLGALSMFIFSVSFIRKSFSSDRKPLLRGFCLQENSIIFSLRCYRC